MPRNKRLLDTRRTRCIMRVMGAAGNRHRGTGEALSNNRGKRNMNSNQKTFLQWLPLRGRPTPGELLAWVVTAKASFLFGGTMKHSIITRPLMRFLAWLAGFPALAILADKLAGMLLKFHIYTGL